MSLLPLLSLLLFLSLFPHPSLSLRPYILITSDDLNPPSDDDQPLLPPSDDFDDFADLNTNPESWRSIFDEDHRLRAVIAATSFGDVAAAVEAAGEVDAAAAGGDAEAQSAAGFLYGMGIGRGRSGGKAVLYHHFAAEGGSLESKMTLAYTYFRQNMYEKSVDLYAELAEMTLASSLISTGPPAIELVRIHIGTEENKEALKKSRGEEYEGFQMVEYQALMGNTEDMYVLGLLYYYGLRGVTRDNEKALHWFSKAAEKREPRAMEFLGEIYARGVGAERNYTKAFQWLKRASEVEDHHSAFNGLGYLYVKGYGVEKNFTKAKEYFEMAANNKDSGGHYNLGVLYLKGIGVKRDVTVACNYFLSAAHSRQPKALYQVAKMFQTGIGLKKNLQRSTYLYKSIAERGPCSSLSRLALESYLKGDLGKALLLYLRLAELGYEVAQSNAAWILDKYGEQSMCMGESGFCTDPERHLRAHLLWWRASEQGNEHAALLIGDAYYYGRGTERDYERAAEAYMHARSQSNAQAIFNLGYMHEHGQGLPLDFHLAKRYYDQALEKDPAAKLPVTLALTSLWIRKNYADTFLVDFIDYLPEVYPAVEEWGEGILMDEGNVTILTLFVCLLTVLYLRDRQRRQRAAPVPPQ